MIEFLTQTNQSLLNQVRATDMGALSGLQIATGASILPEEGYISTDARELAAYYEGIKHPPLGEEISDEDLENFRSIL